MKKEKDFDGDKMGVNPFVSGDFKIVVKTFLDFKELKPDAEGMLLPKETVYEYEKFVKVYVGNKKKNEEADAGVGCLNEYGAALFTWILFKLTAGQDWFVLNRQDYMEDRGISSVNTFKKGLNDLSLKGVIAPVTAHRGYYWINPRFFFCGSRINKYPKNVVEYEPKRRELK